MNHNKYLKRTLELARHGFGKVSPNPRVGAVIVKNGKTISEGYHRKFGAPHAEIDALQKISGNDLAEAVLYVNLEPCSHYGKTPPCTHAIIRSGIKTVVYGMQDPNPQVSGRGLYALSQAGIRVIGPVLEDECIALNAGFIKCVMKSVPWITVKIAQTLDGKISSDQSMQRWITSEDSRLLVHKWRSEHDAVMVGIQTVIMDNPRLNVRHFDGVSPKRIILDQKLSIPCEARVVQKNPESTWIVTSEAYDREKKKKLHDLGVHIVIADCVKKQINLSSLWKTFIDMGVCSIFVEGGQKIFTTFLNSDWIDAIRIFIAPKLFGKGLLSLDDTEIKFLEQMYQFSSFLWKPVGPDMLFEGNITCLQDWLKKPESLKE